MDGCVVGGRKYMGASLGGREGEGCVTGEVGKARMGEEGSEGKMLQETEVKGSDTDLGEREREIEGESNVMLCEVREEG